ncbi:MAG: VWA domain-containing protein [Leptospira sp.]|nr:VWA domain-containing protein [Leptospira sp.]
MDTYQAPAILWLLLPLIGLFCYRMYVLIVKNLPYPRQEISHDHLEKEEVNGWRSYLGILREIFPYIRYLALGLLIVAASGPGKKRQFMPDEKMGIDIMFALDISGSMVKSRDFLPKNRLEVSKELLIDFLAKRVTDRLGLVVFAGAAYLQSPLTNDLNALKEIVGDVTTDAIDEQGTAIGDAILLSTYRLKSSKTKTKIIILLTDGVSNTGRIDPETAAETARAFSVKIYSIGVGKEDGEYEVNFDALTDIAKRTGGLFYHAESPEELDAILKEIDSLEKDILAAKPKEIVETEFRFFLYLSMFFFILDWGGRAYVYRFYP